MRTSVLIFRYAGFALIAILANLATQRFVLAVSAGALVPAILAGTGTGLATKYLLDKKWIFFDAVRPAAEEARTMFLYTATGIVTTAIFWGSEAAFWLIWQTHPMRELGAVIGLTVGYVIKYNLDRHYVFRKPAGRG